MPSYGCVWNATNTQSTTVPIMTLTGSTSKRLFLFELEQGSDATPADYAGTFLIQRHSTAIAGGTTAGPAPLDPADGASTGAYQYAPTSTPTLGTKLFQFTMKQRSTFRWAALSEARRLVIPATANNGLSLLPSVVGGSAANYAGTWFFDE